jgi:hypothetical protein
MTILQHRDLKPELSSSPLRSNRNLYIEKQGLAASEMRSPSEPNMLPNMTARSGGFRHARLPVPPSSFLDRYGGPTARQAAPRAASSRS